MTKTEKITLSRGSQAGKQRLRIQVEHGDSSYYPASLEAFSTTAETSSEHATKNTSVYEVTLIAPCSGFPVFQ